MQGENITVGNHTVNVKPGQHIPGGSYYNYNPSTAAAWIFTILYAIVTAIGLFQTIRKRSWIWLVFIFASTSTFVLINSL